MRPSLICSTLVAVMLVACGGSDAPGTITNPREYCESLAAAWCDRFYECYTPEQIADAGLPRTAGDCQLELELDLLCEDQTEVTLCGADPFQPLHAVSCVGDVSAAVCSQLPARDELDRVCVDLCDEVVAGCDPEQCDPADPTACAVDEACRLDAECGAICDDEVGLGEALDPCDDDGDCAATYHCADTHLCTELCDEDFNCGVGRVCAGAYHADAEVTDCSDGCIPGRGDCPAGMTCGVDSYITGETYCVPAGELPEGSTCDSDSDCMADLLCNRANGASTGVCDLGCDHDNLCAGGRTCYNFAPALMIGPVLVGHCDVIA